MKQLLEKKNSEQMVKPAEKPKLSEGSSNPFAKLLLAKPNKALSEVNNDDDEAANPMAGLFSGLLGGAKNEEEKKDE